MAGDDVIQRVLTPAQRSVPMASAALTDCCLFPIDASLKGGAAAIVASSLLKRGLVEEVPAGKNIIWRTSENGTRLTLRATTSALSVLDEAQS